MGTTRVVHCKREPYDVYIGRPGPYGNPYKVGEDCRSREEAIEMYRHWLVDRLNEDPAYLEPLRGKTLGCWCKPKACHGDVIKGVLEMSDGEPTKT